MSNIANEIENLSCKIKKLLYLQKSTNELSQKLINEKVELLKIIENLQTQLKNLQEENKIIKVTKTFSGSENVEVKKKINEIVREIDKCVILLNN
ncbi:MAG: hypothetical protein WC223_09380 [Bacteroidales bacterium]|jgi:hypothetical protein